MKTATTILLLAFTLIAVPHMAFASTLCAEQSKIKTMKLYNSESRIGLSLTGDLSFSAASDFSEAQGE